MRQDLALELIDAMLMRPSATKEAVLFEIYGRIPDLDDETKTAVTNTLRFDLCMAAFTYRQSKRALAR